MSAAPIFDDSSRATLAGLADAMIPAADGMPSASQAGVAGPLLDAVLTARPDLAEPLMEVIVLVGQQEPASAIADLQANHQESFAILAEVVPGAYYLDPGVRQLVGYPGQTGVEVDETWPPDWIDLLEPVIERGPIYRPA